ncbi:MAG TPA: Fur family transcriptional regulator [Holophagaceae bacterium]|nr:Fur family transcriptional regulator [Holophagaceae bacterium]
MTKRPAKRAADIEQAQGRFETFLRSRGLKLTEERRSLVASVFSEAHHFDADGLHMSQKGQGRDISRATVYRTLDLLVQAGLVRKSSFGDQHAHYEAVRHDEHHDHLICLNCHTILEFYRPDLEALQDRICEEHRFKPLHHSHQIFGLCENCQKKGADELFLAHKVSQLNA